MNRLSAFIDTRVTRFWERVGRATEADAESLACFRVFYCTMLLCFWAPYFGWINRVPAGFFDPPVLSFAKLFKTFPPAPFFALLDGVLLISLVFMAVGFLTRWFTAAYLIGTIVGQSFEYSFGKIDHSMVGLVILIGMLIADWGRAGSVDALLGRVAESPTARLGRQRGLALFAVLLTFGMLTAGLPKVVDWLDFDATTSGFLRWYYPNRDALGRTYLLAGLVPRAPLFLLEIGDYSAIILELCGFVALLSSARWFRIWLATATLFHVLNDLTLNITFLGQFLTYTAFVNWRMSAPRGSALFSALTRPPALVGVGAVAGAAALYHLVTRWLGGGTGIVFAPGGKTADIVALYVAFPIGVAVLALLVRDALNCAPRAIESASPGVVAVDTH